MFRFSADYKVPDLYIKATVKERSGGYQAVVEIGFEGRQDKWFRVSGTDLPSRELAMHVATTMAQSEYKHIRRFLNDAQAQIEGAVRVVDMIASWYKEPTE